MQLDYAYWGPVSQICPIPDKMDWNFGTCLANLPDSGSHRTKLWDLSRKLARLWPRKGDIFGTCLANWPDIGPKRETGPKVGVLIGMLIGMLI